MAKITFESTIAAKSGEPLTEYLKEAPFKIKIPCGKGKCGKCLCYVQGDVNEPTSAERKRLSEDELRAGLRLACEVIVEGEVRVSKVSKKHK